MYIKTVDLISINDAIKATKQKNVILIGNKIIGLDNIKTYIVYNEIPILELSYPILIINYKQLSSFVKNIKNELGFETDIENKIYIKNKDGDTLEVLLDTERSNYYLINNVVVKLKLLDSLQPINIGNDVTNQLSNIYTMKVKDGTYNYMPDGMHYMVLYPSLFPVNKADKIFLNIVDNPIDNYFISEFTIVKKKYNVRIIIGFLKV